MLSSKKECGLKWVINMSMNIYLFKSYYNQAIETAKCASLKNDRPLFEARAIAIDMCAGLL